VSGVKESPAREASWGKWFVSVVVRIGLERFISVWHFLTGISEGEHLVGLFAQGRSFEDLFRQLSV
jgi:hypothetical protein